MDMQLNDGFGVQETQKTPGALWGSDESKTGRLDPEPKKKRLKSVGSAVKAAKIATHQLKHSKPSTKQSHFLRSLHYRPHLRHQSYPSIMMLSISALLLAFIPPLAITVSLSADQYNNFWRFIPVATDTLAILNLRGIHANGRHFWIGKQNSAYCPLQDVPCPPGNETVLDVSGGGASLVSNPSLWCFSSSFL